MNNLPHTSDNIHLSEPQNLDLRPTKPSAVFCNEESAERLEKLISASLSENTKRAYLADLAHFLDAGGHLPATSEMVALYLARFAEQLAVATLTRRLATLSKVHKAHGWPNPCDTELVRSAMRGMRRLHGVAQKQASH